MSTTSGGCFALGDLLPTARYRGEQSGTALFGKIVESPIVWDYIKETHGIGDAGIALALLLDTDWWDLYVGPEGKQSYFEYLLRHHRQLKAAALEALSPEPARPDLLTCNGPDFSKKLPTMTRNEYYEIKSDSPSGLREWFGPQGRPEKGKQVKLDKFYRDFKLRYEEGKTYPAAASKSKALPLPLNRAFQYLASVLIRQLGIKRVLLYISVRLHSAGLLVYKICIEIETDDKRRQEALARAVAKHLYAAYVVCHFPERFGAIEPQLGDHSLRDQPFPRVRCRFNVIPELQPTLQALEQTITMRGIALPGETYILCCDESFYQSLVAKPPEVQIRQLWAQLQAKAENWVNYAGGSVGWSKVKPLMLEVEKVAKYIALMFPDAEDFTNAILSWIAAHPLLTVSIVVTGIVVTAGVAAYLEAALLSAAVIGTESVITETAFVETVGSLGRFAMTEQVAAPMFGREVASAAASRGLLSAAQLSTQIGGTGLAANDGLLLANALARPLLSAAVQRTAVAGVAAATLLMVSSNTAYAAEKGASTVDAKVAKIVSQHASRLYMVRSQDPATYQYPAPVPGSMINVHSYAEPAKRTEPNFSGPPPALKARYLGRLSVS